LGMNYPAARGIKGETTTCKHSMERSDMRSEHGEREGVAPSSYARGGGDVSPQYMERSDTKPSRSKLRGMDPWGNHVNTIPRSLMISHCA
jgi:hypothetical protein